MADYGKHCTTSIFKIESISLVSIPFTFNNTYEMTSLQSKEITFKEEWRLLSPLFRPLFIIQFCELSIVLMDVLMLGLIDNENIAGGAVGMNIINFLWTFNEGVIQTLDTLGSISYGHKSLFEIRLWTYLAVIVITIVCALETFILGFYPLLSSAIFHDSDSYNMHIKSQIFVFMNIPILFIFSYYKTIQKYFQIQKIFIPLVYISITGMVIHLICNILLIQVLHLGVIGCGISRIISHTTQLLIIIGYLVTRKIFLSE